MGFKRLKKFSDNELFLNEKETIIVLKFIFKPSEYKLIDTLPITNKLRGFAQGLLLEAIDASYAIGFVQAIFETTANPSNGARKIILDFGKKASIHWFKHVATTDKKNVKIYDFVRDNLARSFKVVLGKFIAKVDIPEPFGATVAYNIPTQSPLKVYG